MTLLNFSRFGGGISLTVVVGGGCHDGEESSAAPIKDFIQKKFPGAKLTDEHGVCIVTCVFN